MLKNYEDFINETISTWHGSPHKFDKFSLEYMNSGEGNQSYGWGLYFTDKKEIAEYYAKNVGKKFIISDDAPDYNGTNRNKEYLKIAIEHFGDPDAFIKAIRESKPFTHPSGLIEISLYIGGNLNIKILNKRVLINYIKKYAKNLGNSLLYKVVLHDNKNPNDYNYLRWDKQPTNKQYNAALAFLRSLDEKSNFAIDIQKILADEYLRTKEYYTGERLYYALSVAVGSKKASLGLLENGIDGIKYPSEFLSKVTQENSFNYVVFDDKNIKIETVERLFHFS
jgi:hypothetical protein